MPNKIVPYLAHAARNVRGTRIEIGQTLYAIYNPTARRYFIWSYSDRATAESMLSIAPESPGDIAANWRASTKELVPSDRKV